MAKVPPASVLKKGSYGRCSARPRTLYISRRPLGNSDVSLVYRIQPQVSRTSNPPFLLDSERKSHSVGLEDILKTDEKHPYDKCTVYNYIGETLASTLDSWRRAPKTVTDEFEHVPLHEIFGFGLDGGKSFLTRRPLHLQTIPGLTLRNYKRE